eukprot:4877857-Amphidinium_carterae.2
MFRVWSGPCGTIVDTGPPAGSSDKVTLLYTIRMNLLQGMLETISLQMLDFIISCQVENSVRTTQLIVGLSPGVSRIRRLFDISRTPRIRGKFVESLVTSSRSCIRSSLPSGQKGKQSLRRQLSSLA